MKKISQYLVLLFLIAAYGSALSKVDKSVVFSNNQITKINDSEALFSIATPSLIAIHNEIPLTKPINAKPLVNFSATTSKFLASTSTKNTLLSRLNSFHFFEIKSQLSTLLKMKLFPFHSFL